MQSDRMFCKVLLLFFFLRITTFEQFVIAFIEITETNLFVFRIIHISSNFSPSHSIFFQTFTQLLCFSEHSPESPTSTIPSFKKRTFHQSKYQLVYIYIHFFSEQPVTLFIKPDTLNIKIVSICCYICLKMFIIKIYDVYLILRPLLK